MSNHYEWLMQPIDIQFLQKPKPIPSLPFKQIWVIDNYLQPSIHDSWYESRFNTTKWGRQNRVIRNDKIDVKSVLIFNELKFADFKPMLDPSKIG